MSFLSVQDVTLVHPIHQQTSGGAVDQSAESKMLRTSDGKLRGVRALTNVSFTVEQSQRIGILGTNGSGKTTLLRVLAGILIPDSGSVEIEGRATNLININLGSKPDASGHRNITLMGLAHGFSREEIEARRGDIVEFSELGEFLDLPIYTYSAGMRMRLSFAVATAFRPDVLLLDEWLSAGDERFKKKAAERMAEFVNDAGILVLASHSRSLLEQNCERALWLDGGAVRLDGPVGDVFEQYAASLR